jgi:Arc/MetJ family transcription regulator
MVRRTSLNLDLDLLDEAKRVLATKGATDTIHCALRAVVRQARLRRLVERRFDLTQAELNSLREARTALGSF